tara:strand:+ start:721 stop:1869 length:1149 start_codon:yes stop_codon:yes gene_type:complete
MPTDLSTKLIIGEALYDGVSFEPKQNMAVEFSGRFITDVRPASFADTTGASARAEIICPGFVDIQINGANDVQFNDSPTVEGIAAIAKGARKGGTTHILPTYITDRATSYETAIAAVANARANNVSGVLGIHLEGPFISPVRAGVHPPDCIRAIQEKDLELLTQSTCGVRLITLAPEEAQVGAIHRLTQSGAVVFAGHSAASYDEMNIAISEGLKGATHLYNAMSQITVREPGVVGSVLGSNDLYAGVIADGLHVHPTNLQIAKNALDGRLCLVTDAMMTLAGNKTSFDIHGNKIHLSGKQLSDTTGRLAGAHLAMDEAVRNMMSFCNTSLAETLYMASVAPIKAIGLSDMMGRLAPGYIASMTLLDNQINAVATVVDGRVF